MLGDRGLAARDTAWDNMEPAQQSPLRDILDMSEYTGMVFGTLGDVNKGCAVPAVACFAADRGALSSGGTRCITRSHQEALLAGGFIGVLELWQLESVRAASLSDGVDSSAIPLSKLHSAARDHPRTHACTGSPDSQLATSPARKAS
eukprot:jgi/Tetstr1/434641/TSEL_023732.t1